MSRHRRSQDPRDLIARKDDLVVERTQVVRDPTLPADHCQPLDAAWLVTWGAPDAAGAYDGRVCRSWAEVATWLDADRLADTGEGLLSVCGPLYLAAGQGGYVRLPSTKTSAVVTGSSTSNGTLRVDWAEIPVDVWTPPCAVHGLPSAGTPEHRRPILVSPVVAAAMRALGLRHGAAVYEHGKLYEVPGLSTRVTGYLVHHQDLTSEGAS